MTQILSPLPGAFYRSPTPDQAPYKSDGDSVAVGDVIGLIEVLESFHEVKADVAGVNIRFVTDNEDPVMADAVLAELGLMLKRLLIANRGDCGAHQPWRWPGRPAVPAPTRWNIFTTMPPTGSISSR